MGDQANAVLTALGHNLRLVLRWLKALLSKILAAILAAIMPISALKRAA
jgi:IS5 family transposase